MKKYIAIIFIIMLAGVAGSASAAKHNDKALQNQQERLLVAVERIEHRVEKLGISDIDDDLLEFRARIDVATSMSEIKDISKNLHSFYKNLRIQNHAVEVMQKRSASIAEHLARLEAGGKNTDEAEIILQNANVKISALEGDTVKEVQEGIREIYVLFASIAKAVK